MAALNYPDYTVQRWQGTLILYAVVLFAFFFNTVLARLLPFAEGTILAIHVLGWFAILISIIVMGPHHTNAEVWGTFYNLGGYESSGVSFFVGLIGPVFAFMGLVSLECSRETNTTTADGVVRTVQRTCLKKLASHERLSHGR